MVTGVESLGVTADDLLGANDDVALANTIAGLPLLAVEEGLAEPVVLQPNTGAIPPVDGPCPQPAVAGRGGQAGCAPPRL